MTLRFMKKSNTVCVVVTAHVNFTFSGESEINSAPPPATASHHQKGFANLGFY